MTDLDLRTPVLVGAAALRQRKDDPAAALDAFGLMVQATHGAAGDAGAPALLDRIGLVCVPEGTWRGGFGATQVGAPDSAHTVLARVGVLQQTSLTPRRHCHRLW